MNQATLHDEVSAIFEKHGATSKDVRIWELSKGRHLLSAKVSDLDSSIIDSIHEECGIQKSDTTIEVTS